MVNDEAAIRYRAIQAESEAYVLEDLRSGDRSIFADPPIKVADVIHEIDVVAARLRAKAGVRPSYTQARARVILDRAAGVATKERRQRAARDREDARNGVLASQAVERRLNKVGNGSTSVVLPAAMLSTLGWHPGDDVLVRMEGKAIIIE